MKLSTRDFDFVRALAAERAGIALSPEKTYLAESRLLMLAQREGLASPSELIARLRSGRANGLAQKVVEAMTTNETSFFRDVLPFEMLRKEIVPELLDKRGAARRLTIWCAASSTGQEPYSVAILLREYFPQLSNWTVRILATDLCSDVLARGRQGLFSQLEVNRGLRAALLVKYFEAQGPDWQLKDDIRAMVEYRQLNLIEPFTTMPAQDLIFLRNVLIYFDVATKKKVLEWTRQVIQPDGYLFLGGTESAFGLDECYERRYAPAAACFRLKSR